MRISNMAWSNFKGNMYRYIMYCLSNSFAVAAFFIFANFLMHPSIKMTELGGHEIAAAGAMVAVYTCLIIIAIFSVLFVWYSISIFLKSRGKEFGLLSLYGMTKSQIRKYVFIESSIISIISLVIGIITGVVFSKLFLMIMEYFLGISLVFNISLTALFGTIGIFFILFEVVNIVALLNIRDKQIIEQIRSTKEPKELPNFSKKKAILGIVLLLVGYILAWLAKGAMVVLGMMPITIIVVIGTYFIFTEFSIYFADKLMKKDKIKYDKTNLLVYSQIIFKLQDTAKVLFLSAILGAITFTATETVYTFYDKVAVIQNFDTVEDIAISQHGENAIGEEAVNDILNRLVENDIKIKDSYNIELVRGINLDFEKGRNTAENTLIISESEYNKIADKYNNKDFGEKVSLKKGEVVYNYPHRVMDFAGVETMSRLPLEEVKLKIKGEEKEFNIVGEKKGTIVSLYKVGERDMFIMNDDDFADIYEVGNRLDNILFSAINVDSLKRSFDVSAEISEEYIESGDVAGWYFKSLPYVEARRSFGMILFIGLFISFLFLIATGSIIYFKLFNEIKEDKKDYDILNNIGMTKKEKKKIITKQIGIIFFLPFIVSTLHSFYALKSLSNLLDLNLIVNGLVVMFGYLIFQSIYFIFIRNAYIKKIEYIK